jgi:hypothetical protein
MCDPDLAADGEGACTISELINRVVTEFKWSRAEAWQRVRRVAETRGLAEVICSIQQVGKSPTFLTRQTESVKDGDRRRVVPSPVLKALREEYPRAIGSKRGPKPRWDWSGAYDALTLHWEKTGGPPEKKAVDELFVKEWFAATFNREPGERTIREKVGEWRAAAKRGR